jgi:hypothetical protein
MWRDHEFDALEMGKIDSGFLPRDAQLIAANRTCWPWSSAS